MADKVRQEPRSKYGFSLEHDAVLDLCKKRGAVCPHNCAKDGSPNCYYFVSRRECEPAREATEIPEDRAQAARHAPRLPGM